MKSDNRLHKHLGLAFGFPVGVYVAHHEKGTVAVYVFVYMPYWQGFDVEGRIERGAGFNFDIEVGVKTISGKHFSSDKGSTASWERHDFFAQPWEEVVCPDSPYFPDGVMAVELTMTPITRA